MPEATISRETLYRALVAASPRLSPEPTPLASVLIHAVIVGLWVLVIARAFLADGIVAWSVGIVYVSYDTALLALVFWQTLPLAGPPPVPAAPGEALPSTLAVIVAARDEAAVLPKTLAALLGQSVPPDLVVIADDGSSDGTATLLRSDYGFVEPPLGTMSGRGTAHPALRWMRLPHGGKPAALNAAMLEIDTDIVLTVDADTLLDRDAIAAIRRAFAADSRLVAATGLLTPVCGRGWDGRLFEWFQTYEYLRNFLSRYAWMRMDSLLLISGAFAAFRRAPVLAVGGFDPACLVEDYELIHRLRRHSVRLGLGWTTAVLGEARGVTEAPGSTSAFLRQRRRWFGGFLQTQYWYRGMVGNPAFGRLGLLMLPVKAADTWQPIYGLTAFALLLVDLLRGRVDLFGPAFGVIGAKLVIDLAFLLWSIRLYRRWAGPAATARAAPGLLAALLEPFTFQILRHLGAALGWVMVLTGGRGWGRQRRLGPGTGGAGVVRPDGAGTPLA